MTHVIFCKYVFLIEFPFMAKPLQPRELKLRSCRSSARGGPLTSWIPQPCRLRSRLSTITTHASLEIEHCFSGLRFVYSKTGSMASAHAYHAATTRRMSKVETAPAVTQAPAHTTTMLNRWSVAEKILPCKSHCS